MPPSHARKSSEIEPRTLTVQLTPGAKGAFADRAASLHFSEHCSSEMLSTMQDLAQGRGLSAEDLVVSLTMMSKCVFEHVHKTGDQRPAEIWEDVSSQFLEKGFTFTRHQAKTR